MSCFPPQPVYPNPPFRGITHARNDGVNNDGYSTGLRWFQAYSPSYQFQIGYNIYYSSIQEDVFKEQPKFVVVDPKAASAIIPPQLTLGDVYFFAVRAFLYEPGLNRLSALPNAAEGLKTYPEAVLLADVSQTALSIPISDPDLFPPYGIIQLGTELMRYSNIDFGTSSLIVSQRGYLNTHQRQHNVDGYDGKYYQNPLVFYFKGLEDDNTSTIMEEVKFFESYPFVLSDGYRERVEDLLHADMVGDDLENGQIPPPGYAGYHSLDPATLLSGVCVGSYMWGEVQGGCADGYNDVNMQVRAGGITTENQQREEMLLSVTGEPVILLQRLTTGKYCYCFDSTRESPASPRCPVCFGTSFVSGFKQFSNVPRRSDGRIMVHFDPTIESLPDLEAGQESTFNPNSWTIAFPTIRDRDVIVRFNTDGINEEYRYEVLNVTRNKLALNSFGAQKLTLSRIRKTDIIYSVPIFGNSAAMPTSINTSIGFLRGPQGQMLPHNHSLIVSENITSLSQINQQTGVSQGHNHTIYQGRVLEALGHTHDLVLV